MTTTQNRARVLIEAKSAYDQAVSPHYDEVLHDVTRRVTDTGSIGKSDIGALLFWKRLRADAPWVRELMGTSDTGVREVTTQVVTAARDITLETPEAARRSRAHLSHLPGFRSGDALASALLLTASPDRMAVYDKRAQAAIERLGLTLTARRGRYGRYMQIVEDLRGDLQEQAGVAWTARDVDLALYWLGGSNDAIALATTNNDV